MSRWFLPALQAVLTVVFAIAAGIAALDPSLAKYAHPAQIVVLIVGFLSIVITVILNRPRPPYTLPLDQVAFNNLKNTVSEAKHITFLDPGLENEDDWADKLGRWKDAAKSLKTMAGEEKDGVFEIVYKEPAQELLELTTTIIRAMLQRGWKKELIELARPAYYIAIKLQNWEDAAVLAQGLARANYDLNNAEGVKKWTDYMAKNKDKDQIDQKSSRVMELQLQYLELQGLVAKQRHNVNDERFHFNQALNIAQKIKLSASGTAQVRIANIIATLQLHLAELAELDDLDQAVNQYKDIVQSAVDPEVLMRCYERLGNIALASLKYDEAYGYFEQQKSISSKLGPQAQSMAWEGMGKVLRRKPLLRQDYSSDKEYKEAEKALQKKAYSELKKALEIEEEGDPDSARAHRLRIEIVRLTDKILLQL